MVQIFFSLNICSFSTILCPTDDIGLGLMGDDNGNKSSLSQFRYTLFWTVTQYL